MTGKVVVKLLEVCESVLLTVLMCVSDETVQELAGELVEHGLISEVGVERLTCVWSVKRQIYTCVGVILHGNVLFLYPAV